jgi:hypothetical protein
MNGRTEKTLVLDEMIDYWISQTKRLLTFGLPVLLGKKMSLWFQLLSTGFSVTFSQKHPH